MRRVLGISLLTFGLSMIACTEVVAPFSLNDILTDNYGIDAQMNGQTWRSEYPFVIWRNGALEIKARGPFGGMLTIILDSVTEGTRDIGAGSKDKVVYSDGRFEFVSDTPTARGIFTISKINRQRKYLKGHFWLKLHSKQLGMTMVFSHGKFERLTYVD